VNRNGRIGPREKCLIQRLLNDINISQEWKAIGDCHVKQGLLCTNMAGKLTRIELSCLGEQQ
jgi:hypothetical protein